MFKKGFFMVLLVFTSILLGGINYASPAIQIQWFGHSCFLLTSAEGIKVLIDPYNERVGYPVPSLEADLVTTSHEHGDHNNVGVAKGKPVILRGLDKDGADWAKVSYRLKDVSLYNVPSFHDKEEGKRRGKNAIFVFEVSGLRIVHLGDLGHVLASKEIEAIKKVDILLLPVGGTYTIDAKEATEVVSQLKPSVVIPIHYKTDVIKLPISPVDDFLKGKENVRRVKGNIYSVDKEKLPSTLEIIVLDYK